MGDIKLPLLVPQATLRYMMLYGVHGTTVEISERIRQNGFKPSQIGRAGPGVYLWRYFKNDTYAKNLAYKWWEFASRTGVYNKIGGNTSFCCISVELNPDTYIDLSHGLMRETIRDLILSKIDEVKSKSTDKSISNEQIISGLFTTFVKQIEKIQGISFDAVITDVPPPKGSAGDVGKYIGSCAEVIVVRNLDIIKVTKMERIDNET